MGNIQGIPIEIISEYAEATENDIPEYGIKQWLCDELLKCREQLKKQNCLPTDKNISDEANKQGCLYSESIERVDGLEDGFVNGAEYVINFINNSCKIHKN